MPDKLEDSVAPLLLENGFQEVVQQTTSSTENTKLDSSAETTTVKEVMGQLKYLSLAVLVVQNTSLVLVMRYSLTMEGPRYITTTAVASAEIIKLAVCCLFVLYENNWQLSTTFHLLKSEIFDNYIGTLKVSVPSLLYTVQNNLLYVAISNLDAATFQVTYQLKLFTTALFSVLLLKRRLTWLQWAAVLVLMSAVALIQWPTGDNSHSVSHSQALVGLVTVLLACISSGFAGVYFEKILKGSNTSLWIRNIQLGILGVIFGFLVSFVRDGSRIMDQGFFYGYNYVVIGTIILQAVGGLVVAAVIKYADNILKGFATAVSIVLSLILAYFVLGDYTPSLRFLVGTGLVIGSTILYSNPTTLCKARQSSPPDNLPFAITKNTTST